MRPRDVFRIERGEGAGVDEKRDPGVPGVRNIAAVGLMNGEADAQSFLYVDRWKMLVSMSRNARNSLPRLSTTDVFICWRIMGGPMFDFVGLSMTSTRSAKDGPFTTTGQVVGEPEEETRGLWGKELWRSRSSWVKELWRWSCGVAGARGLVDFFTTACRGMGSPSTFQAFCSSSLSSGMPQNLSARCLRLSKGTSDTYRGNNC